MLPVMPVSVTLGLYNVSPWGLGLTSLVLSGYDVWSAGLRNRTSCLGSRSSRCWALHLLL